MRRAMVRAHQMGMTNGQFAFLYVDFYNGNKKYEWTNVDDSNVSSSRCHYREGCSSLGSFVSSPRVVSLTRSVFITDTAKRRNEIISFERLILNGSSTVNAVAGDQLL